MDGGVIVYIIKDICENGTLDPGCINHNGGDDQYDQDTGAGVNCGGSVTN